jgi:hypothetical protein
MGFRHESYSGMPLNGPSPRWADFALERFNLHKPSVEFFNSRRMVALGNNVDKPATPFVTLMIDGKIISAECSKCGDPLGMGRGLGTPEEQEAKMLEAFNRHVRMRHPAPTD